MTRGENASERETTAREVGAGHPASAPAVPRINGARIFGARLNSPFHFTIAASGARPMTFAAAGLPPGLGLDRISGRITGAGLVPGTWQVSLSATNVHGAATGSLRIVIGERYALTPPMGWNSWNCWGGAVSQEKVLEAAKAMVGSGLQNHGWAYINIDDGWQGQRGGPTRALQPNQKFPNMPGLADSVHALGLKFGLYSTPWRGT